MHLLHSFSLLCIQSLLIMHYSLACSLHTAQVAEDLYAGIFGEDFDRIVPGGDWLLLALAGGW